jgi:hypothetical protein
LLAAQNAESAKREHRNVRQTVALTSDLPPQQIRCVPPEALRAAVKLTGM